jgi:hypothetical protein
VREQLGRIVGSAKALVVQGDIDYKTPSQEVPGTIRENVNYLVQEMFRAAYVRFKSGGLTPESGESIRLQHSELNEMLQGFAKALAEAEQQLVWFYYVWTTPTLDMAAKAFDAAQYEAVYPDEFFTDDLLDDLTAWAEAIRMNLGPTMAKRIKKRAARRIDPDMPLEDQQQVDAEIDGQDDDTLNGVPKFGLDMGQPPPEDDAEAV